MSNNITRKIQRAARNKSMRSGLVFRTDSASTKPLPIEQKAAARSKAKLAKACRKKNR